MEWKDKWYIIGEEYAIKAFQLKQNNLDVKQHLQLPNLRTPHQNTAFTNGFLNKLGELNEKQRKKNQNTNEA